MGDTSYYKIQNGLCQRLDGPSGQPVRGDTRFKGLQGKLSPEQGCYWFGNAKALPYIHAAHAPIASPKQLCVFKQEPEFLDRMQQISHELLASGFNFTRAGIVEYLQKIQTGKAKIKYGYMDASAYPDFINETLDPTETFAHDFVRTDKYPSRVIFKPNHNAGGEGVTRIHRNNGSISISVNNPNTFTTECLEAYAHRYRQAISYEKSRDAVKLIIPNNEPQHLKNILNLLRAGIDGYDLSRISNLLEEASVKVDLDVGLIQEEAEYLKSGTNLLEGRYRVKHIPEYTTELNTSKDDPRKHGSYLKVGRTNADCVNNGQGFIPWHQCMHQRVLTAAGSDAPLAQMDAFMRALIQSNVVSYWRFITEAGASFLNSEMHSELDAFWDLNGIARVELEDGSTVELPDPKMIELHLGDELSRLRPVHRDGYQVNFA